MVPSDSGFDPGVHLCFGDVSVDSRQAPSCIRKVSKTDPFRKGVALIIGKGSVDLCPVAAVLDYMVRRGSVEVHCSNSVMEGFHREKTRRITL